MRQVQQVFKCNACRSVSMCTLHLFVYICVCVFCYPCSRGMFMHLFRLYIYIHVRFVCVLRRQAAHLYSGASGCDAVTLASRTPRSPSAHQGEQGSIRLAAGGRTLQTSIRQNTLSPHTRWGGTEWSRRRRRNEGAGGNERRREAGDC